MNYGKIFKYLRKEKGLSQKQVAAGIVSQSTLSRFEESGNIDFFVTDSSVETTRNVSFGIYAVLYRFRNRRF